MLVYEEAIMRAKASIVLVGDGRVGARPFLGTLALFTTTLVSAGCQRTPPLLPGRINVPAGQTLRVLAFPDYFGKTTLTRFEAETGNKIALTTYATNEELLQRVAADATFDVVFPASYAVERMIREGKLLAIPRERVPNLVHISTEFRNPPHDPSLRHCVPYGWAAAGLGFVWTKDSKGPEPDSLTNLFAKDGPRVVWLDDMRATMGLALRQLGRSASTQQAADLNEAQELLIAALPRVDALVASPGPLLATSAVSMSMAWSTEIYNLHRDRPDIRFGLGQEGTLLYVTYACVLSQSTHQDVASAFVNHLLDPQVAAEISNDRMLPMPNEEARRLLEGEGRSMWGLFEYLRNHNRSYETPHDVGAAQPAYEQAWLKVKEAFAAEKARRKNEPPARSPSAKTAEKSSSKAGEKAVRGATAIPRPPT